MGVIRLGVVGCGFISGIHQQAFAKLRGKMEITGCCDLIIERADATTWIFFCGISETR